MKHLLLVTYALLFSFLTQNAVYAVNPPNLPYTVVSGWGWHYKVPFEVVHLKEIDKLIQCESQGKNIARPDSNGVLSYGILQFNGTSTWGDFEAKSGILGSPMSPPYAIAMADWAISHGYLSRWTCARITGLI